MNEQTISPSAPALGGNSSGTSAQTSHMAFELNVLTFHASLFRHRQQVEKLQKDVEAFSQMVSTTGENYRDSNAKLHARVDDIDRKFDDLRSLLMDQLRGILSQLKTPDVDLARPQDGENLDRDMQVVSDKALTSPNQSRKRNSRRSTVKPNRDEDDILTESDHDEIQDPNRSVSKRLRLTPKTACARAKTVSRRATFLERHRQAAEERFQQENPQSYIAIRRFLYDFIEGIEDKDLSMNVQLTLVRDLPNVFREGKPRANNRFAVIGGRPDWREFCQVLDSVEAAGNGE